MKKLLTNDMLHFSIWLVEFFFLCYNIILDKFGMVVLWGVMLVFNVMMFIRMQQIRKGKHPDHSERYLKKEL